MRVSGLTEFGALAVIHKVSNMYDGNVIIKGDITRVSANTLNVALRVDSSKGKGARRSPRGRRGPWACWHVFRDFCRAVFEYNPDARIVTAIARYNADNFEYDYPDTDWSPTMKTYWSNLCDCEGEHGE